jgi:hypothetical protein
LTVAPFVRDGNGMRRRLAGTMQLNHEGTRMNTKGKHPLIDE